MPPRPDVLFNLFFPFTLRYASYLRITVSFKLLSWSLTRRALLHCVRSAALLWSFEFFLVLLELGHKYFFTPLNPQQIFTVTFLGVLLIE